MAILVWKKKKMKLKAERHNLADQLGGSLTEDPQVVLYNPTYSKVENVYEYDPTEIESVHYTAYENSMAKEEY